MTEVVIAAAFPLISVVAVYVLSRVPVSRRRTTRQTFDVGTSGAPNKPETPRPLK